MAKKIRFSETYVYNGNIYLKGNTHVVPDDLRLIPGTGVVLEEGLKDEFFSEADNDKIPSFEVKVGRDTGSDSSQPDLPTDLPSGKSTLAEALLEKTDGEDTPSTE